MGKGDIKTRRGKLFAGTFGVRRPKKKKNKSITRHHRMPDVSAPKPKPEKPEMITREVGEPVEIQKTEVPAAPTEEQVITVSIPAAAKAEGPKTKVEKPSTRAEAHETKVKKPAAKAEGPKTKVEKPSTRAESPKKKAPAAKKTEKTE